MCQLLNHGGRQTKQKNNNANLMHLPSGETPSVRASHSTGWKICNGDKPKKCATIKIIIKWLVAQPRSTLPHHRWWLLWNVSADVKISRETTAVIKSTDFHCYIDMITPKRVLPNKPSPPILRDEAWSCSLISIYTQLTWSLLTSIFLQFK